MPSIPSSARFNYIVGNDKTIERFQQLYDLEFIAEVPYLHESVISMADLQNKITAFNQQFNQGLSVFKTYYEDISTDSRFDDGFKNVIYWLFNDKYLI